MSPTAMIRRAIAGGGVKALKYSAVSVVGVVVTQVLIFAFHGPAGLSATLTNFLAVSLASVPAYYLNRAWVWGKRGRNSIRREVLPFWGFSLLGLAVSTVAVSVVAGMWDNPLAINVANIGSFGLLWVAKYLVLDAVMFGADETPAVDPCAATEPAPEFV